MKFLIITILLILFLLMSMLGSYFFWEVKLDWKIELILVVSPFLFLNVLIEYLRNYSKIVQLKPRLTVKKLFSIKEYDFNEVYSWKEVIGYGRFRRMEINLQEEVLEVTNMVDPKNYAALHHQLCTHFECKRLD